VAVFKAGKTFWKGGNRLKVPKSPSFLVFHREKGVFGNAYRKKKKIKILGGRGFVKPRHNAFNGGKKSIVYKLGESWG